MNRVLLIDRDSDFARSLAMECLQSGIAIRMAETLSDGVRYLLHAPVALVLVEAGLLRLAGPDQVRLFDLVAPGVPVVVIMPASASAEERVRLELQGLTVMTRPFDVAEVLAKAVLLGKPGVARPGAGSRVDAICGQ